MTENAPAPNFDHLLRMTDRQGTFEHAELAEPRREHGYCTDDMARVLVVATRQPDSTGEVNRLAGVAVRFLNDAQSFAGTCRNRMDRNGRWTDEPALEDAWGRCLWGLGTAAAHSDVGLVRRLAVVQFDRAAVVRSPWPRAMAFAGLGAAEMLRVDPGNAKARALLADAAAAVGAFRADLPWPWPEPRLTYANAVLPDVLLAAGDSLHDDRLVGRGLEMLGWLVELQCGPDHLSLTPAAGWVAGEPWPGFDQQPIEAATLADACARAFDLTGDARWSDVVELAAAWFQGRNDSATPLVDRVDAGCCDGLELHGRNENQGAESTLALVTTTQHATRLAGSRS